MRELIQEVEREFPKANITYQRPTGYKTATLARIYLDGPSDHPDHTLEAFADDDGGYQLLLNCREWLRSQ